MNAKATVKAKRPETGHLLIGGCFYRHTGYGVDQSWLASPNPEAYLFTEKDFSDGGESFGARFVMPAMREDLPTLLLDLPMHRENGVIKLSQGLTVLYLPEGKPWRSAQIVHTFAWHEDMIIGENWRQWDRDWFFGCIRGTLNQELRASRSVIRKQRSGIALEQTILASL